MHAVGLQDPHAVAIVEAALILEAGWPRVRSADRGNLHARSSEPRFAARQKIDLERRDEEVQRRMAAQLPDEEKIKAADYVIDNSGSLEQRLVSRWRDIWEKLRNQAEAVNRHLTTFQGLEYLQAPPLAYRAQQHFRMNLGTFLLP